MDPISGNVVSLIVDEKDTTIALCGENSIYFTVKNLVDIFNSYELAIDIRNDNQAMDSSWYALEAKTGFNTWEPINGDSISLLYGLKKTFRVKFTFKLL